MSDLWLLSIKCLKQFREPRLLHTCALISDLPSTISAMVCMVVDFCGKTLNISWSTSHPNFILMYWMSQKSFPSFFIATHLIKVDKTSWTFSLCMIINRTTLKKFWLYTQNLCLKFSFFHLLIANVTTISLHACLQVVWVLGDVPGPSGINLALINPQQILPEVRFGPVLDFPVVGRTEIPYVFGKQWSPTASQAKPLCGKCLHTDPLTMRFSSNRAEQFGIYNANSTFSLKTCVSF